MSIYRSNFKTYRNKQLYLLSKLFHRVTITKELISNEMPDVYYFICFNEPFINRINLIKAYKEFIDGYKYPYSAISLKEIELAIDNGSTFCNLIFEEVLPLRYYLIKNGVKVKKIIYDEQRRN